MAFRDVIEAVRREVRRFLYPPPPTPRAAKVAAKQVIGPIARLVVADEVSRTLFAEYAAHRASSRGHEEIGWTLLGIRQDDEAIVLATLPAGVNRSAGATHVQFNSIAQELACRIVRQSHRQLMPLGLLHTHPGSMRHPSDGDYRGDINWVEGLRGGQGVFGIGTASEQPGRVPAVHEQERESLTFSWYTLSAGERNYRDVPVSIEPGPDLALELRTVWDEIETHAGRLNSLAGQLALVRFAIGSGSQKPALIVRVALVDNARSIEVMMEGKDVRYFVADGSQIMVAEFRDDRVDRGVYAMLTELSR